MKSAFDFNHVKSVKAWALTFKGEMAGRIVANYSDNPAGSVCVASAGFWGGPFKDKEHSTGRAGGYGYDKFSAAVSEALHKIGVVNELDGRWLKSNALFIGDSSVKNFLEAKGYKVLEVI